MLSLFAITESLIKRLCMTFDSSHIFGCKTKLLPLVDQFKKANNTNYVINDYFPQLIIWG